MEIVIGAASYKNKFQKIEDFTLSLYVVIFRSSFITTYDENIIYDMTRAGLSCYVLKVIGIEQNDDEITITMERGNVGWQDAKDPFNTVVDFKPNKNDIVKGEIYQ